MSHVKDWFASRVPLNVEESLGHVEDDHVYVFVADVVKLFDPVDRRLRIVSSIGLAWLAWLVSSRLFPSWHLALEKLGPETVASPKVVILG